MATPIQKDSSSCRRSGAYPICPIRLSVRHQGRLDAFSTAGAESAAPLEATAEDKFQIERAAVFTFDAAKNQMTVKRRHGERVFTKEKPSEKCRTTPTRLPEATRISGSRFA